LYGRKNVRKAKRGGAGGIGGGRIGK